VFVVLLGVPTAGADVRIDKSTPARPVTPSTPPATEPRVESRGCAGREMAPEWLFGLGVLALGLGGMRRARQAATA